PGEQLDTCQDAPGRALCLHTADGVGDLDGFLSVSGTLLPHPTITVCAPQAGEVHGFVVAVADLAVDGQRLPIQLDSPGRLAEFGVTLAEVGQADGFALAVADLAVDGQRLLIQLDGPGGLAEIAVAVGETAQGGGLAPLVAGLPDDGQHLHIQLNGPRDLA